MHRTSASDMFHSGGGSGGYQSSKLCFDPTEFHSDTFSIDEFIQRKRQLVPLDVLRDDLGSYLKTLRSSLIELINHDYGQFVNLSSNLVGLDSQIYNITKPLKVVQHDLEGLRDHLQSTLDALNKQLHEKRLIQGIQKHAQYLRLAKSTLESAQNYIEQLSLNLNSTKGADAGMHDLRTLQFICSEIAQVQFLSEKCDESLSFISNLEVPSNPSPFLVEIREGYHVCASFILEKLEYLLEFYGNGAPSLKISQSEMESSVITLLDMYSELRQHEKAEEIFIAKILKPRCAQVLAKKGNIIALLEEIEVFLTSCPILTTSRQVHHFPWLTQFNFIHNGLFPYLINIFMKQFPHIWSPSSPDQFFTHWKRFEVFLEKLENSLPSAKHLQEFRESSILKEFISKWQFHVYFQLRFHNLAIELESALDTLVTSPCGTSDFKLDATRVLVKVVNQCWDPEKTFIMQLSGRFLKASALFIARYLKEVGIQINTICDNSDNTIKPAPVPFSSVEKTAADSSTSTVKIQQLINIHYDLNLGELVLGQILIEKIEFIVSSQVREGNSSDSQEKEAVDVNAREFLAQFTWDHTKHTVETHLIQMILGQMISHITAVNEVPRLFRRTNREAPTTRSDYVDAMLKPLLSFENMIRAQVDPNLKGELWCKVVESVGTQLAQRYANQVQEVLTSVQRMEESLKRLKKVKAGAGGGGGVIANANSVNNNANANAKMSDDDKIRKQIRIDVEYLISKIQQLCPNLDVSPLQNINYT